MTTKSELFLDYAKSFMGIPYIYGGKSRTPGLDCSGFVMQCLEAFGVLEGEFNAQEIYNELSAKGNNLINDMGVLFFFGKSKTLISHVAIELIPGLMIECGGGDHTTRTIEEAAKRNACVRIRPITHRKDQVGFLII